MPRCWLEIERLEKRIARWTRKPIPGADGRSVEDALAEPAADAPKARDRGARTEEVVVISADKLRAASERYEAAVRRVEERRAAMELAGTLPTRKRRR